MGTVLERSCTHVAVAGNIGVGKSTLTGYLAKHLGARAYLETVEESVYLERFYREKRRWSFHSQMFFLTQALAQHAEIVESNAICIQDRTIYEHFHVFATSLYRQGEMEAADFELLERHFSTLVRMIPHPELVIYLKGSVPTLLERIRQRKRLPEAGIAPAYLEHLQERYDEWIDHYVENNVCNVLIIDTDEIDMHDEGERTAVFELIEQSLGLPAERLAVA